jgi:chromate transporter
MSDPSFQEFTRVFARIGCLSFGGPAGQIALMHKELVDDRRWVSEERFLRALNFCHLLPGPEAQQLAAYIGWRLHGLKGGLVAGMLFVLPGAVVIWALSVLYVHAAGLDWFAALFLGIKAAVLALVVQAVVRIGRRALKTMFKRVLAAVSFVALFAFDLPFPIVVLGAGGLGMLIAARRPEWLALKDAPEERGSLPPARPLIASTLKTVLAWGLLWALPIGVIWAFLGPDHVFLDIGTFFSQLAVVTFGGAYAVLAYMAQEAVQSYHWLKPGEMADGLGLAESTPGPLIMVTQFVGFLGAYRDPAPFSPMAAGTIGALLTTWVTFVPCFLYIFTFAPWIERLEHARRLQGGLAALTAAVVGVIANLAVWFALHVIFSRVVAARVGQIEIQMPDIRSIDWLAFGLAGLATILLFRTKLGVIGTLAICAACAVTASMIRP